MVAKGKPAPKLILVSRRGTRVEVWMRCDDCGHHFDLVWRYAESNRGTVHLCGLCKAEAFNRSFGKLDAMWRAWQGGRFDGNRTAGGGVRSPRAMRPVEGDFLDLKSLLTQYWGLFKEDAHARLACGCCLRKLPSAVVVGGTCPDCQTHLQCARCGEAFHPSADSEGQLCESCVSGFRNEEEQLRAEGKIAGATVIRHERMWLTIRDTDCEHRFRPD